MTPAAVNQGRPQDFFQGVIGGGRGQWLGSTMTNAEHEPITEVWGQSPQRGPGADFHEVSESDTVERFDRRRTSFARTVNRLQAMKEGPRVVSVSGCL